MDTSLSPFNFARIFNAYTDENNFNYYNLYNSLNIPEDIADSLYILHEWTPTDNWYSLSSKFYNNVELWWIILAANQIVNPFDELDAGTHIKILKSQVVSDILSHINLAKNNQ